MISLLSFSVACRRRLHTSQAHLSADQIQHSATAQSDSGCRQQILQIQCAHCLAHSGVGCEPLPCTYTESAPVITSDHILHLLAVFGVDGGPSSCKPRHYLPPQHEYLVDVAITQHLHSSAAALRMSYCIMSRTSCCT